MTGDPTGPAQADVDAVRHILDITVNFSDNDQRARFLLSSGWMHDQGAAAAARNHRVHQGIKARYGSEGPSVPVTVPANPYLHGGDC